MQATLESRRLAELQELHLLDRPVEERFDHIALITQHLFQVPMVSITVIDETRQWRLAYLGPLQREAPLHGAICTTAMLSTPSLVVPDLTADARFRDSPYVCGDPSLRFYAGAPLHTPSGHPVGALCVMDVVPRRLSRGQSEDLLDLARWTDTVIEQHRGSQRV